MRSLIWSGSYSLPDSTSSEVSFSGEEGVKREVKLIETSNRDIDEDEGPLFSIKFLQGGGSSICGGIMTSGARFCMTRAGYCTTALHARQKGVSEELPGG